MAKLQFISDNSILRRKSVKYAIPFLLFVLGGSFGLKHFTNLRYQFSRKESVTREELKEKGIDLKDSSEISLEKEYDKMTKMDIDNWSQVRGPRPWEEISQLRMSDSDLFESDEEVHNRSIQNVLSDSVNFIPETPEKSTTLRKSITKMPAETNNDTVHFEKNIFENYKIRIFKTSNDSLLNTNLNRKSPHVFYEIECILKFTELCQPSNKNVKLIGFHFQRDTNVHYLIKNYDSQKVPSAKIMLNFQYSKEVPKSARNIEIYGCVEFNVVRNSSLPFVKVTLWKYVEGDLNSYINCLKLQNVFVPECYKEIVSYDNLTNTTFSKVECDFEEIDESQLYKDIEFIEQKLSSI